MKKATVRLWLWLASGSRKPDPTQDAAKLRLAPRKRPGGEPDIGLRPHEYYSQAPTQTSRHDAPWAQRREWCRRPTPRQPTSPPPKPSEDVPEDEGEGSEEEVECDDPPMEPPQEPQEPGDNREADPDDPTDGAEVGSEIWRNILGLDVTEASSSDSMPMFLPADVADLIQATLSRATDHQLRSILSGWARFQAQLNEEVAQLCSAEVDRRAQRRAAGARPKEDAKTEEHSLFQRHRPAVKLVPRRPDWEEPLDETSFMQKQETTLQPYPKPSIEPHAIPQVLHQALSNMPFYTARARARGLLHHVQSYPQRLVLDRDLLEATLVAFAQDPGERMEDTPVGASGGCLWVSWWWRRCTGQYSPEPEEVETLSDKDEAEAEREQEDQLRRYLAEKEEEEKAEEAAVEWHLAQTEASQHQAANDSLMAEAAGYSYRPPRPRPQVEFTSRMGKNSRTFALDLEDKPWTMQITASVGQWPGQWYYRGEPVDDSRLPPHLRISEPASSTDEVQPASKRRCSSSTVFSMHDPWVVGAYTLWRKGVYSDAKIQQLGGTLLLEFLRAERERQQNAFNMEDPTTYGIFVIWKEGRLTDAQVLQHGGTALLSFVRVCALPFPEDTVATQPQPPPSKVSTAPFPTAALAPSLQSVGPGSEQPHRAHNNGRRRSSGGSVPSSDKDD